MRKIKKFNENLDYDVIDISLDEYNTLSNSNYENMNPTEVKSLFEYFSKFAKIDSITYTTNNYKTILNIKKSLPYKFKDRIDKPDWAGYIVPRLYINFNCRESKRHKNIIKIYVTIIKLKDEWFLVKLHNWSISRVECFKIDQFEGLMEFLEKRFSNIITDIDVEYEELKMLTSKKLKKINTEYYSYSKEKLISLYNSIKKI